MKTNIKKLVILSLSLLLVLGGCGSKSEQSTVDKIKEKGVLTIATSPDYPPMEFIDSTKSGQEQYVGSDIELGRYIADKLGVELNIQVMDFTAVLASVSLGQADIAISGFGWKEDREENFELSHGYNFDGEASCHGLVVKSDDVDKYQTLADFNGKKIIAQSGSLQESYSVAQIENANMQLVMSLDVGLLMLQTGQADAFALSCDLAKAYALSNSDLEKATPEFVLTDKEANSGNLVAVRKGDTDFINYVNEIIDEVNELGLYETWYSDAKALALSLGIEFEE